MIEQRQSPADTWERAWREAWAEWWSWPEVRRQLYRDAEGRALRVAHTPDPDARFDFGDGEGEQPIEVVETGLSLIPPGGFTCRELDAGEMDR